MTTPSIEERVARLEGGYEHLATKADVETLRADMLAALSNTEGQVYSALADTNRRIDRLFWAIIGIGGGLLAVAVAAPVRSIAV